MPSEGGHEGACLDQAALAQLLRSMGTTAEFRSMLREFLHASDRLLGDLSAAAGSGRAREVERTAHTMKSMAHVVGARALETTCRELELRARGPERLPPEAVAGLCMLVHETQGAVERILS